MGSSNRQSPSFFGGIAGDPEPEPTKPSAVNPSKLPSSINNERSIHPPVRAPRARSGLRTDRLENLACENSSLAPTNQEFGLPRLLRGLMRRLEEASASDRSYSAISSSE